MFLELALFKFGHKRKKVVVLCSRPRQNERTGNFTDVVVVQRGLRNAQKSVIHVQSCFANTSLLLFCCSRCRRPCRYLSSQINWVWTSLPQRICYREKPIHAYQTQSHERGVHTQWNKGCVPLTPSERQLPVTSDWRCDVKRNVKSPNEKIGNG